MPSLAGGAASESLPIEIHAGIAADQGRNAARLAAGLAPDTPGLAAAMATLLDCPVEASAGGVAGTYRCRERMERSGLAHGGALDVSGIQALSGGRAIALSIRIPDSPAASVTSGQVRFRRVEPAAASAAWRAAGRAEFRGTIAAADPRISYRAGFENGWLLGVALLPAPLLLWWLVTAPRRWLWVSGVALWLGALSYAGMLQADSYFSHVPSVEGAFLRWVTLMPLVVLVIGQAQWLHPAGNTLRVWAPIAIVMSLRPLSADWMSSGEQLLSAGVSMGLFTLAAGPMLGRGRELAFLPEDLAGALQERLRRLAIPGGAGGFDIRLDRRPSQRGGEAGGGPRFGRVVIIPEGWLERLRGGSGSGGNEPLETAVLLAAARTRHAPLASVLAGLLAIWILAFALTAALARFHQTQWLAMALVPFAALGWYSFRERAWDRRVARDVLALGAAPETLLAALASVEPEWGAAASRRIARQAARHEQIGRPSGEC